MVAESASTKMAKFDFNEDLSIPFPLGVALSSDGRRVAIVESYANWRRNSHLVRLLVRSTSGDAAPACVAEGWNSIATPLWVDGDAKLCWSGVKNGKALLAVWDAKSGGLARVQSGWTGVDAFAWNKQNGRLLVLVRYQGSGGETTSQTRLVWIGLGTKTLVNALEVAGAFNAGSLRISPSGKEAVFTGTPGPDHRDQRRHLYLYDVDRHACTPILEGDNAVFSPTWHESRRSLVYLKRKGAWNDLDGASLHRLHLESGDEELLSEGLEYAWRCWLSPMAGLSPAFLMFFSSPTSTAGPHTRFPSISSLASRCFFPTIGAAPVVGLTFARESAGVSGSWSVSTS